MGQSIDIATRIIDSLAVGSSVCVYGEESEIEDGKMVFRDKGDMVLYWLIILDLDRNVIMDTNGRLRRRRVRPVRTIGGPLAMKMFEYKIDITEDGQKRTTIWRIQ